MRCSACSTVSPSGTVSEYITDLPLFSNSMMSRIEACGLISYSPAFRAESLPKARTPSRKTRASLISPRRSSCSAISWTPVSGLTRKVSALAEGPGSLNSCLPKYNAKPAARTISITREMTKFMNTTNWLREARERLGGGVPASGRNASLAVFGTIGPDVADRCPNCPLSAEFVLMAPYRLILQRIPLGTVGANMAKLTTRIDRAGRRTGQPL
ncbi:conserved hypothetical protein [Mesorhizobium prunaredense]|uniref:Uncharacterized protein n=1 Tax=Mesorhizobium prunaredense TaxID=1631249 RepID=A0A1R3VFN7_9HYPH|nr:conserved hypothetical protein [Mesorhizobium prunaredense]